MALDANDPRNRLWPWILEKADRTTDLTSHSHLDILYFLVKEKNDVIVHPANRL